MQILIRYMKMPEFLKNVCNVLNCLRGVCFLRSHIILAVFLAVLVCSWPA